MVSHDCKCQVCGKPFKHRGTDAHVCSVACNEAAPGAGDHPFIKAMLREGAEEITLAPDALESAISYLGAVEVAPNAYALPNELPFPNRPTNTHIFLNGSRPNMNHWWVVSGGQLAYFWEQREKHHWEPEREIQRLCCIVQHGVAMPSWWTPELPFAVRGNNGGIISRHPTIESAKVAERFWGAGGPTQWIVTANLDTGAETDVA